MKTPKPFQIFIIFTVSLLLVIPVIFIKRGTMLVSELDNRFLMDMPEFSDTYEYRQGVEQYVEDRIGFRDNFTAIYQNFCLKTLGEMVHPNYVLGKEGHYFGVLDLSTYQHKPYPADYPDDLAGFMKSLQDYVTNQGKSFQMVLLPNKGDVYGEFFPEAYSQGDKIGILDDICTSLHKKGVNFIYPRYKYIAMRKAGIDVFNKKYDVLHFNDLGGLELAEEIYNAMPEVFGAFPKDIFELHSVEKEYLEQSLIKINETVPYITQESDAYIDYSGETFARLNYIDTRGFGRHVMNWDNPDGPRTLLVGDSYFGVGEMDKYFINASSEVYMIHSANLMNMQQILADINPDVVIVELVGRVLFSDAVSPFSEESMKYRY